MCWLIYINCIISLSSTRKHWNICTRWCYCHSSHRTDVVLRRYTDTILYTNMLKRCVPTHTHTQARFSRPLSSEMDKTTAEWKSVEESQRRTTGGYNSFYKRSHKYITLWKYKFTEADNYEWVFSLTAITDTAWCHFEEHAIRQFFLNEKKSCFRCIKKPLTNTGHITNRKDKKQLFITLRRY